MKLRRVLTADGIETQHEITTGHWQRYENLDVVGGTIFDRSYEVRAARSNTGEAGELLPFQPLSFRDFMLYEKHAIDAARGLIRRFHPGQYRAVSAIEKLTGRTFPMLRPSALFYRQPIYYMSNHLTFVPSGTPVRAPRYSRALDFELEIGFVLAAPLRDATAEEALDAIGAFVLLNDFSARDVQRAEMASGFGPQKSKHFLSSMSATAVTADEILPRIDSLRGTVALNGVVTSTVSSAGMRWGLGEVLAHASRSEQLLPGELFGTGTLPGGSGMETGTWPAPGDVLTLTLDGIGQVEHRILDR